MSRAFLALNRSLPPSLPDVLACGGFPARVARLAYFRPENTNLACLELLGCKILAFGIFVKTGIF